jgi:hypothetical protein
MSKLSSSKFQCGTISEIKPILAGLLKECGRVKEHPRAFDISNVPNNEINKGYHVEVNNVRTITKDISCFELEADAQVTCWYCTGVNEADAVQNALIDGEGIFATICNPINKDKLGCLHSLEFSGMNVQPFSNSNDNIVTLTMDFVARVFIDVCAEI